MILIIRARYVRVVLRISVARSEAPEFIRGVVQRCTEPVLIVDTINVLVIPHSIVYEA